jgi:predicted porin
MLKRHVRAAFSKTLFSNLYQGMFMKKTMIALAAFGAVAGAAHAQSSVTLYGLVDMYLGEGVTKTSNAGTTAKSGMSLTSGGLSGSRWGMRGAEDLGGGMRATFQLEAGIEADDGTVGAGFNRTSKLGLAGGFGSIEMGRQYTRVFNLVDTYDAQGTDAFSATSAFGLGGVAGGGKGGAGLMGSSVRWSNSLVYTAPTVGGFSASVQYAFGENGTPALSSGRSVGVLIGYATGPFSMHLAHESAKNMAPVSIANAPTASTTAFGASYDLGVVKLLGQVINQKDGFVNGDRENAYVFGVSVPLGSAGSLNAGAGKETLKTANVKAGKATSFGVEYRYSLSKRTTAYAGLGHLKSTVTATNVATKTQNYGVGVRHAF